MKIHYIVCVFVLGRLKERERERERPDYTSKTLGTAHCVPGKKWWDVKILIAWDLVMDW